MELSALADELESGGGARIGKYDCHQTIRVYATFNARTCSNVRSISARSCKHCDRLRSRNRRSAGASSESRKNRLHRKRQCGTPYRHAGSRTIEEGFFGIEWQ